MKRSAFAILVLLLCGAADDSGCSKTSVLNGDAQDVGAVIREGRLQYARDPKTGLCFAYTYIRKGEGNNATGGAVITAVSCVSERRDTL
jgi:hypothetical protein